MSAYKLTDSVPMLIIRSVRMIRFRVVSNPNSQICTHNHLSTPCQRVHPMLCFTTLSRLFLNYLLSCIQIFSQLLKSTTGIIKLLNHKAQSELLFYFIQYHSLKLYRIVFLNFHEDPIPEYLSLISQEHVGCCLSYIAMLLQCFLIISKKAIDKKG